MKALSFDDADKIKGTWTASNIGASLLLSVVLLCTFTLIEIRKRRLSRSLYKFILSMEVVTRLLSKVTQV